MNRDMTDNEQAAIEARLDCTPKVDPCEKLRKECERLSAHGKILEAELKERNAEVERLREVIDEYGCHSAACENLMRYDLDPTCTCGFSEALKESSDGSR